jgi:hypothetical protein
MANDQQEEPVPTTIVYGNANKSKSYVGVASKVKVSDRLTVTPRLGQFNLKNKKKGVNVKSTDIGVQGEYKINKNITLHTGYKKKKTKVRYSGGTDSSKGKGFNFGISIDF